MLKVKGYKYIKKILTLFVLALIVIANVAYGMDSDVFDQSVTVKFKKNKLGVALERLSGEVGVEIIYDEKISNNLVSGAFKDVPFSEVVNRLLSGLNHSLNMDLERKTLVIKAFGEANYVSTSAVNSDEYVTDIGIPILELHALHEKQSEEFAQQLKDTKEFLGEVGMTRGELRELHEQQSEQFKQNQQNPGQFLEDLNMTRGQLYEMRKKQLAAYTGEINNDKTFLAELGVTMGEHRSMLVGQAAVYDKNLQDKDEYLPEIGMTRGEHQRLLAQQMEKFQQSLTK